MSIGIERTRRERVKMIIPCDDTGVESLSEFSKKSAEDARERDPQLK